MISAAKRRSIRSVSVWPGYVDALSALLMVVIFVLLIFAIAHFLLSQILSSQESELVSLHQRVNELVELALGDRGEDPGEVPPAEERVDAGDGLRDPRRDHGMGVEHRRALEPPDDHLFERIPLVVRTDEGSRLAQRGPGPLGFHLTSSSFGALY